MATKRALSGASKKEVEAAEITELEEMMLESEHPSPNNAQLRMIYSHGWMPDDVPVFENKKQMGNWITKAREAGDIWAREYKKRFPNTPTGDPHLRLANGMAWKMLLDLGVSPSALPGPEQCGMEAIRDIWRDKGYSHPPLACSMADFERIWRHEGFQAQPWDIVGLHLEYPNVSVERFKQYSPGQAKTAFSRIKEREDTAKSQPVATRASGGSEKGGKTGSEEGAKTASGDTPTSTPTDSVRGMPGPSDAKKWRSN